MQCCITKPSHIDAVLAKQAERKRRDNEEAKKAAAEHEGHAKIRNERLNLLDAKQAKMRKKLQLQAESDEREIEKERQAIHERHKQFSLRKNEAERKARQTSAQLRGANVVKDAARDAAFTEYQAKLCEFKEAEESMQMELADAKGELAVARFDKTQADKLSAEYVSKVNDLESLVSMKESKISKLDQQISNMEEEIAMAQEECEAKDMKIKIMTDAFARMSVPQSICSSASASSWATEANVRPHVVKRRFPKSERPDSVLRLSELGENFHPYIVSADTSLSETGVGHSWALSGTKIGEGSQGYFMVAKGLDGTSDEERRLSAHKQNLTSAGVKAVRDLMQSVVRGAFGTVGTPTFGAKVSTDQQEFLKELTAYHEAEELAAELKLEWPSSVQHLVDYSLKDNILFFPLYQMTLLDYHQQYTMDENLLLSIFEHVCDGLEFLHKLGMVHRDVKLANTMCTHPDENGMVHVVIIDLGYASRATIPNVERCGTLVCLSKELCAWSEEVTAGMNKPNDMWGVGIMMAQLCTEACVNPFMRSDADVSELTMRDRVEIGFNFHDHVKPVCCPGSNILTHWPATRSNHRAAVLLLA